MAWTTPGTAVAGDVLTAAFWNTQVRDNMIELAPFFASWTSYTPTLSQGGAVAKTVETARYLKVGKMAIVQVRLTVTGTGTANNRVEVGMPSAFTTASRSNFWSQGQGVIYDSSAAAAYQCAADAYTFGTYVVLYSTASSFDNTMGNASTPFSAALANNDRIGFSVTIETT